MIQSTLSKDQKKIIALACLGAALEYYDFIIFIFFAAILSRTFFPEFDKAAAIMATYTVFAIGYLARPIGGLFFGYIGDKFGRKNTFALTVAVMALPSFLIALLPSYQQIGITATVLIVLLRLLQGFSVGGEIPGATVFAAESVSTRHRGFACSLIYLGINSGLLLGSFVSAVIINYLTPAQQLSWGWRIAFLFGSLLGWVSYYLRKKIKESPIFLQMQQSFTHSKAPLKELFANYRLKILQGILITALSAVIISIVFLYMPNYLSSTFGYARERVEIINTVMVAIFSLLIAVAGYINDIIGRRYLFLFAAILLGVSAYPLYSIFAWHSIYSVIFVYSILVILSAAIVSCYPAMLIELFPTRIRYTGYAFSYNIAYAIFGGLTPLVAESIIQYSKQPALASVCLIASALLAIVALVFVKEKQWASLDGI